MPVAAKKALQRIAPIGRDDCNRFFGWSFIFCHILRFGGLVGVVYYLLIRRGWRRGSLWLIITWLICFFVHSLKVPTFTCPDYTGYACDIASGLRYYGAMLLATPQNLREAVRHLAEHDGVLAPVITQAGPCTMRPHREYYRALGDSIIGQQLSVK